MVELRTRRPDGGTISGNIYRIPRVFRFLCVGAVASLLQLALLYVIQLSGIPKLLANFFAFEISTQVNFGLSYLITWYDRTPERPTLRYLIVRLLGFNGMAITTLIINMSVFALMLMYVHFMIAGALAILAAATTNFIVSSRIIFRRRKGFSRGAPGGGLSRWPF